MQVKGHVGTYADLLSILSSDDSSATATSSSSFTAEYTLTEEFDFILDTTLSTQLVEDGYSFRLRDVSSDIDLINFQPEDGQSHRLELCGTLSPGTYELIVDTESSATTYTSGAPDFGGFGEFDFYFRAIDFDSVPATPSNSIGLLEDELIVPNGDWRPVELWTADGGNMVSYSAHSVPEPGAWELLVPCLLLLLVLLRSHEDSAQ